MLFFLILLGNFLVKPNIGTFNFEHILIDEVSIYEKKIILDLCDRLNKSYQTSKFSKFSRNLEYLS